MWLKQIFLQQDSITIIGVHKSNLVNIVHTKSTIEVICLHTRNLHTAAYKGKSYEQIASLVPQLGLGASQSKIFLSVS